MQGLGSRVAFPRRRVANLYRLWGSTVDDIHPALPYGP